VSEAYAEEVGRVEEVMEGLRREEGMKEVIRDYRDGTSLPSTQDDATLWLHLQTQITLVSDLLPPKPLVFNYLTLDLVPLRTQLLSHLQGKLSHLELRVVHQLEFDTHSLKSELSRAFDTLLPKQESITGYIEQLTTLKVFGAPHMRSQLETRQRQISQLSQMLGGRASRQLTQDVRGIEEMMGEMPRVIGEAQARVKRAKRLVEEQLRASC